MHQQGVQLFLRQLNLLQQLSFLLLILLTKKEIVNF